MIKASAVFSIAGEAETDHGLTFQRIAGWPAAPSKNIRAVQLLLEHTKLDSTVRYLGMEIVDALERADHAEI